MDSVVHFEIPVDDIARAQSFYQGVFGWKMNPVPNMNYTIVWTAPTDDATRMVKTPGTINGGMLKRVGCIQKPIITINVQDINQSLEHVKSGGGTVVGEVTRVGDMGLSAYVQDTEGNVIGLWQNLKKM